MSEAMMRLMDEALSESELRPPAEFFQEMIDQKVIDAQGRVLLKGPRGLDMEEVAEPVEAV